MLQIAATLDPAICQPIPQLAAGFPRAFPPTENPILTKLHPRIMIKII
jgi:hypothetical protein